MVLGAPGNGEYDILDQRTSSNPEMAEAEMYKIEPQSQLGLGVLVEIFGDDVEDSFSIDKTLFDQEISLEKIDAAIATVVNTTSLGYVAQAISENGDDPISQRLAQIGRRVALSLTLIRAYTDEDVSESQIHILAPGVLGQYTVDSQEASGISLDVEGVLSEDWREKIVHVMTHEVTHLQTNSMINDIEDKGDIKIKGQMIMTAIEVIEAMTEHAASRKTGKNIAYKGPQSDLEELVGAENLDWINNAFLANDVEEYTERLMVCIEPDINEIEEDKKSELVSEDALVEMGPMVRQNILIGESPHEISLTNTCTDVVTDLIQEYHVYLPSGDMRELEEAAREIDSGVIKAAFPGMKDPIDNMMGLDEAEAIIKRIGNKTHGIKSALESDQSRETLQDMERGLTGIDENVQAGVNAVRRHKGHI